MKKIIFTKTRNPGIYFKIWIEYYSRYFDRILVIDDGSTDDEILRYQNVHRVVDRFQRMVRRWHGRGQEVSMQKFYDHYYKMPYGYINDFKVEPIPDEIRKANKF